MKRRWTAPWTVFFLLLVSLFWHRPAAAQEKHYWAERFDVTITVEEGGALLIQEQTTYHFAGEPFTFIYRELPTDHTDGVTILDTRLDGDRLPAGTGPGQVEIEGGDPLRVTWHMAPTVDQSRTVELVYRMEGVVRQGEGSDLLRYQVLPDDYDFFVESSSNRFLYPGRASLLAQPEVLAGQAVVRVEGGETVVSGAGFEAGDPLVVELRFRPGSIIAEAPAWQARQQAQRALVPWWLALATAIFLAGGAGLVAFQTRFRPPPASAPTGREYEPPTALAPALAGTLTGSGLNASWSQGLATLFSLAERDLLTIVEAGEKKWYRSTNFLLIRGDAREERLLPHEQQLLEMIFQPGKGDGEAVKLSDLGRRISSRPWKDYQEAVRAELKAAGLLDPERQQAKHVLTIVGVLLLFPGLAGLLLGVVGGPWALSPALSVLFVALLALIYASAFQPLSEKGAEVSARWQPFRDYMRAVSKGKAPVTRPDLFERYLPYAASFDLLSAWAKHFAKEEGTELPSWFHPISATGRDSMAAFVAMSAAVSTSGGSAAGAAGAGAAGGGAAGAG